MKSRAFIHNPLVIYKFAPLLYDGNIIIVQKHQVRQAHGQAGKQARQTSVAIAMYTSKFRNPARKRTKRSKYRAAKLQNPI